MLKIGGSSGGISAKGRLGLVLPDIRKEGPAAHPHPSPVLTADTTRHTTLPGILLLAT